MIATLFLAYTSLLATAVTGLMLMMAHKQRLEQAEQRLRVAPMAVHNRQ
jgi:hypothetical protein